MFIISRLLEQFLNTKEGMNFRHNKTVSILAFGKHWFLFCHKNDHQASGVIVMWEEPNVNFLESPLLYSALDILSLSLCS